VSTGFFKIESLLSISLTTMATPGGFGQLTFAFGFVLGRKPLRDWRCLHVRVGPQVISHLEGDPNQVGQLLSIVGAAGVRFDALKQRPGLVGAELDFLEASEQFEALKHGALHWRRDETFGWRLGCPV
jgi:hypothetical protein